MDKGVREEVVGENAYKKVVGPHNRCEGGICTEERKSVPTVKRREGRSEGVCKGAVEKRVHSAVEITINSAGVLCRKKGWEEEDGVRLLLS